MLFRSVRDEVVQSSPWTSISHDDYTAHASPDAELAKVLHGFVLELSTHLSPLTRHASNIPCADPFFSFCDFEACGGTGDESRTYRACGIERSDRYSMRHFPDKPGN